MRLEFKKQKEQNELVMAELRNLKEYIMINEAKMTDLLTNGLPRQLCEQINRRFEINGAIAVTADNVREIFNELINQPGGILQQILEGQEKIMENQHSSNSNSNHQNEGSTKATATGQQEHKEGYNGVLHMWPRSDAFHKVPANFKWPSDTVFAMWELWFCGNPSIQVGPYKEINPKIDLPKLKCKTNRAKTGRVVNSLVDIAIANGFITKKRDVNHMNAHHIFDLTYPELIQQVYGSHPRSIDINIYTLANKLYN